MTSSYQSTSFQSSARPVDTFVRQSTVPLIEEDGFSQLTKALSAVNPILDIYADKAIKAEQEEGLKLAIDKVLSDGGIGKEANQIRKQDGDSAARQLVGNSIFADRVYSKAVASLYSSQLNADMQQAYLDAEIDTFDRSGNPAKRSIREFTPSDQEFVDWRQGYIQSYTNKIFNEGGDVDSADFSLNLKNSIININKIAREQNNEYKVEKIKSLSTDHLNKASKDWLSGDRVGAKIHITDFINETRLLGLTGGDATDIYNGLLDNISAMGEFYIGTADESVLDDIDDLILGLGNSIPYGNKKDGNLTQHPLWQEKIGPVLEKLEDEIYEEATRGPTIDKAKRTIKLKKQLKRVNELPIDTEDQRDVYKQEINKLKNNREFSDLNEIFKSNNYPFIEDYTAEILNIRTSMRQRAYEDNEDPLEQLAVIKNKIVDLGITDKGILSSLNQTIGLADEYKSIYQRFDLKSKDLFDDVKEFYGAKSKTKGFGSVKFGNTNITLGGGLDNDSLMEKYNTEQEIDQNFEDWIDDNFYQTIDGKQIGGPSDAQFRQWLADERERVEKDVFGIKTPSERMIDDISNRPVNERRGFGFGNEDDDFNENVPQTETPGLGNSRFEVEPSVASEVSDEEAKRIIEAEDANEYLVQAGDTLSAIAENLGTTVRDIMDANNITNADLISIGQQLRIPEPKPLFIDQYRGKPVPDFGGLGKLIISGESAGHGIYNAFNKGTTASAGTMDITSKTIAEMEQMQAEGKVFAVGAYQLTPGVLTEARETAGIASDAIMTPAVQDRLFWGMLTGGQKRPELTAYLLGESDDLNAAHEALALEFAVIQGPDGKGRYDKDKSGNFARIKAALVKQALIKARKEISNQ